MRFRVALTVLLAGLFPAATSSAETVPRCAQLTFSVAVAPDQAADQTIVGWLCGPLEGHTLQILLHGASYDHTYWDFPLEPSTYSYVRAATNAGYVTLDLDRLGSGLASHPDPIALSLHEGAYAVHQVVQRMRSGVVTGLGSYAAQRVILVGHSLGSGVASVEASAYRDVDGVILSAFAHSLGPDVVTLEASTIPAQLDPKFASANLPLGYLTGRAGTRAADFYYEPNADPAVIALDEELKQTFTLGEVADIGPSESTSSGIVAPTLVAVGAYDSLYCAQTPCSTSGSLSSESSNYDPRACVEIEVVPDSGHDLNLHKNAPAWFADALRWSDAHVGPDSNAPIPGCG